jgi:hypothetical protein
MSNQIFAHGIKSILHDPQALVEALQAKFNVQTPAATPELEGNALGQMALWL